MHYENDITERKRIAEIKESEKNIGIFLRMQDVFFKPVWMEPF